MNDKDKNITTNKYVEEPSPQYGFVTRSEDEKLREDANRSGLEKLQLFTRMLRRNALLDKGSTRHAG